MPSFETTPALWLSTNTNRVSRLLNCTSPSIRGSKLIFRFKLFPLVTKVQDRTANTSPVAYIWRQENTQNNLHCAGKPTLEVRLEVVSGCFDEMSRDF